MRKLSLVLFVLVLAFTNVLAQTRVKGVVKIAGSENPLQGAKVTLLQQNISTQTNANGEFLLSYVEPGDEEISISRQGYFQQIKLIKINKDVENDLGVIFLQADVQSEMKQETVLQLSESALDDDDSKSECIGSSIGKRRCI